jgi:hypothetical protein
MNKSNINSNKDKPVKKGGIFEFLSNLNLDKLKDNELSIESNNKSIEQNKINIDYGDFIVTSKIKPDINENITKPNLENKKDISIHEKKVDKKVEQKIEQKVENKQIIKEKDIDINSETNDKKIKLEEALKMFASKDVIRCNSCLKTFTVIGSLRRHYERSEACLGLKKLSKLNNFIPETTAAIPKPIHLFIDDILEKAIRNNDKLECKYCKLTFSSRGNHHKHYAFAVSCNKLAFLEFKRLINEI